MPEVRRLVAPHSGRQRITSDLIKVRHVTEAALAGAHIATVPLDVLRKMIHHPLTDAGILQFRKDWEAVQGVTAVTMRSSFSRDRRPERRAWP